MPLDPPRPALPPLNALRAFEAAARHGSFQRAAEELAVSPGAIAQQIKKLEDWAGARLFERHAQGVTLTAKGAEVLPRLTQAFDLLGEAAQALRQSPGMAPVRIAALPAIAQLWLSPRLSALHEALPDVDISIHALDRRPRLSRGDFDVAVYMEPSDSTEEGKVLASNRLVPVAAPALADTIQAPKDLARATLLHDSAWDRDWRSWLSANNITGIAPERGPTHSLYSIAVERCMAGDGVLMGHTALLDPYLSDGRLVALFPEMAIPGPSIRLFQRAESGSDAALTRLIAELGNLEGGEDA